MHVTLVLALPLAGDETVPVPAAPSARPPHVGPSPFAFRVEDPWWYHAPMPALRACFERETLEALHYGLSNGLAHGYRAEQLSSWTAFESPGEPDELSGELFHGSVVGCVDAAKSAGWSGRGRVHIRVLRGDDGRARAQAWPLDDEASSDRLLCCLRESQELLAPHIRRGKEARYVMSFSAGKVELKPNPLPRPLEEYRVETCLGACEF